MTSFVGPESSTTSSGTSNLPVPIQARFNCDQLALIFGTCLVDAVFVVDVETGSLVGANEKLLELLQQALPTLESAEYPFDRLVHPDDRALLNTWISEAETHAETEKSFQIRILRSDGMNVPVELRLRSLRWQRRLYALGFVEECAERHRRDARLRADAEQQKQRAVKALESSLRMYELNEKIKSTLALTTQLLRAEDEEQLFRESALLLTNEEGLNFKGASFLLLEGGELRVVRSTLSARQTVYPLNGDNRYARLFQTGFALKEGTSSKELIFPLRSRDTLLGLVEVHQHQREREYIDNSRPLRDWQSDLLEQIGDIIAMLLDNLRLYRELKRQSSLDSLTDAVNRNHFMNRLTIEVQRAKRYGRPTSLIFLDVDYFKEINDQYGHLQGDQVLRELAQIFRSTLRSTDLMGRYGGDEFVLLLPETDADRARETAEKVVSSVRDHHFKNLDDPGQSVPVTVSVGLAALQPGQDEERFLQSADAALYQAKKDGRNRAFISVAE